MRSNKINTKNLAKKIRLHALRMTNRGGASHIASILSMADIIAVLYGAVLQVDPVNPSWPGRDRFILSKGHAGAGVYAALAERGFFNTDRLMTYYQDGSDFSGHVSHKGIPGVELSTGSLGHGLSVGVGKALAGKLDDSHYRTFVMLSDGECDEGANWEAILFAAHHRLENLIAIVDYNKIQSLASVAETLELEPFAEKWSSFGWGIRELDGHDHEMLLDAFDSLPFRSGRPSVLIANTVKGKGVSFMENSVLWHYRCASGEEFEAALKELDANT